MHMALLLGYGATAINPYLAFETIAAMGLRQELNKPLGVDVALENYVEAICKGLLKIMSKMGISTLRSYRSAQVFEAIGLSRAIVDKYFPGTSSRIAGIGLDEIAAEANERYNEAHNKAPDAPSILTSGGHYRVRSDGERHQLTPESITLLQQAVRKNDPFLYRNYAELINNQTEKTSTLRGMFCFKPKAPIPLKKLNRQRKS